MLIVPSRELRQYSNRKLFLALAGIISLAFIGTLASVLVMSKLMIYRQDAQSHNDMRVQLVSLVTDLADADTAQRGYLLTSSPKFLAKYQEAAKNSRNKADSIEHALASSATRTDAKGLNKLVQQKLVALEGEIGQSRSGGTIANPALSQEQVLTDKIRTLDTKLQNYENGQLEQDRGNVRKLAGIARDISLLSMFATLILAALIYQIYLKAIQVERRLDQARDEFVSLASHQLRTPATGIKAILSSLIAGDFGPLNERQSYFMSRANESNERELAIIEELLNVAKVDAGRLILHSSEFDLRELLRAVLREQSSSFALKNQHLVVRQPKHPIPIVADEEKLYMALGNIIDNARKYTGESGKISVAISSAQDEARIEVADTGEGINSADIKYIFDRFHRATDALHGNVDGAGLGLYLANRIVELHEGRIEVYSKPGKGTKFVMILPQGDLHAAPSPDS